VFGRKTALGLLTGAFAATGVVGGGAAVWAANAKTTQAGDVIQACAGDHGVLRLAVPDCRAHESVISWNVEGQQGPVGPQGPQGPQGPAGVGSGPTFDVLPFVANNVAHRTGYVLSTHPTAIPDLQLVLPRPGTYLIAADVRGVLVQSAGHDCFLMAQFVQGSPGTAVSGTQRTVVTDFTTPGTVVDGTAPIQTVLTTTVANTVVEVSAFAVNSLGNACAGVGRIISDRHGASTLNAVRIH
jgi:hypothetical protein